MSSGQGGPCTQVAIRTIFVHPIGKWTRATPSRPRALVAGGSGQGRPGTMPRGTMPGPYLPQAGRRLQADRGNRARTSLDLCDTTRRGRVQHS